MMKDLKQEELNKVEEMIFSKCVKAMGLEDMVVKGCALMGIDVNAHLEKWEKRIKPFMNDYGEVDYKKLEEAFPQYADYIPKKNFKMHHIADMMLKCLIK